MNDLNRMPILSHFKVIDTLASKYADFHLKEIGLTRSQASVIFFLANEEDKGFINWVPDPKDSRARRILLTDNAKQIVDSIKNSVNQTEKILLAGLSEEEITWLAKMLKVMADNAINNA